MTTATAADDERERARRAAEAMQRVAVSATVAADALRRCARAFESAAVALRTMTENVMRARERERAGKGKANG